MIRHEHSNRNQLVPQTSRERRSRNSERRGQPAVSNPLSARSEDGRIARTARAGEKAAGENGHASTSRLNGDSIGQWIPAARPVVITGGAGFIGANLARRLLAVGQPVLVFDNLSRAGVPRNLSWLRRQFGEAVVVELGDIRDYAAVKKAVKNACAVFHCAAQVAVTSSLTRPHEDFAINAEGTLNLLESLRHRADPPPLLFTSTNKVYGAMSDMRLNETALAYVPAGESSFRPGVDETAALNFHSPYGCSKGCAEQYVLDYAHSFGLPATVFRMSCIYGPLQCGNEDQGWVAHFASAISRRQPITIYGNGKQVRDLLFVDDLIDAMFLALCHIERTRGRAFNIGGGPTNAQSVLEVIRLLSEVTNTHPVVKFADWRVADQRYYVSDTASFRQISNWAPKTEVRAGVEQLCQWLNAPDSQSTHNGASSQA